MSLVINKFFPILITPSLGMASELIMIDKKGQRFEEDPDITSAVFSGKLINVKKA
jgi:hypothetical protein